MAGTSPNWSVSDFAVALNKAYLDMFSQATISSYLKSVDGIDQLFQTTQSDGDSEDYAYDTGLGTLARVDNSAYPRYGVGDQKYTLANYEYGAEYQIQRRVWEDDRKGFIKNQMAGVSVSFPIRLMTDFYALLTGATSTVCHDGQYFFDTDHPTSQTNADQNKLVATTDLATSIQNASYVFNIMGGFKDKHGSYLNMRPKVVLTGTGDTGNAWDIIAGSINYPAVAGPTMNPLYGKVTVVHMPHIANPVWYAFDTSKPIKPFVNQERLQPEVQVFEPSAASPDFVVRLRVRYRLGYGFWPCAILGDAS